MASASKKSAAKANLLGKRKLEDDLISVKEVARRKRTVLVKCLPVRIKISDIIDFFEDVGEVVRVQLLLKERGARTCYGFVEFSSAYEVNKALQKKNGEYLQTRRIYLHSPYLLQPKYYMDHTVCSGDYPGRESILIEEDETPSDFVEEVLFVANLSPQTKIFHIFNFFKHRGGVVSVRLIVNHEGKHVGYGFLEFGSSEVAKKALEKVNGKYLQGHQIFLDVAKTAPYPPRPNCNLAERLCYEDYLRRESLMIEDDETVEGLDATPEAVSLRKKSLFVGHLSPQTEISHIIDFFKDVGEVVHVRLFVDQNGKHVGNGFVEFASSNEAKKALKKKNNEYLHDCKIVLSLPKTAPYPPGPEYCCIDHNVWYEDYLQQEGLLIEDEADEIPILVEEVAVRKKTLFIDNITHIKIGALIDFFANVGEVVSVRLIANHEGKRVGCGFLEFASANEAKKALKYKNGERIYWGQSTIFLDVVQIAPYPLRPKYNLAEKLWYEDYLQRESLQVEDNDLETKLNLKKHNVFCGKKITFSDDDD